MAIQAPNTFKTSRLFLRRPRPDDALAIFEEYTQDAEVSRYTTWRPHAALSDTQAFLARCLTRWESGEEFSWVITLLSDDRAIGMITYRIKDSFKAELGYVLARRLWNQGFTSEAARAVIDWALATEGTFRVHSYCDISNAASARVMEKAGMQREGILRRWTIHPNISPEPRDCFVYSRTR
ncbi:MAG TPA: GNAT family N-acetyltransferase [Phycisphaerae bacterium]|nr:GNAT family N-acetyltransferase [Phycisphaerae bacterium]